MKKQIVGMLLMSVAMLQADFEVISETGSKPSKFTGIIEIRNDTKDDLGVGIGIQGKGNALFRENRAIQGNRTNGRLNAKDYVRITEMVGGASKQDPKTATLVPLDVKEQFELHIYNPTTHKWANYRLKKNDKRKIIALVVEKDKDGAISVRPQRGSKAKGFFTGSGASSNIHLSGNITDEDIQKQ